MLIVALLKTAPKNIGLFKLLFITSSLAVFATNGDCTPKGKGTKLDGGGHPRAAGILRGVMIGWGAPEAAVHCGCGGTSL